METKKDLIGFCINPNDIDKINKIQHLTCTACGGNATVAVTKCEDKNGNNLIKKGERLCMKCYKKLAKDE